MIKDERAFKEKVRELVIINASKYGKTSIDFIIPKIIGIFPEIRDKLKEHLIYIKEIVDEVNKMDKERLENEAKKLAKNQEKKHKQKILDTGNVNAITRFAPEPSGFLHLGHAKAAFLSYTIAKENNGHMHLRFDDTNPEKSKIEYVNAIIEDLEWLGIKPSSITYTSDYIEEMYKMMEKLIEKGKAFICFCNDEEIANYRSTGKACPHRDSKIEDNIKNFHKMIKGEFKKGEAVLLYKGDMKSKNTALRDPAIARISKHKHFRHLDKYILWPTYHFASVFMDVKQNITHAIRSKEYELFQDLYYSLLNDMYENVKINLIHISRLFIPGYPLSKRGIRAFIEQGKLSSWDDPRLLTLKALKRRGIHPEAIKTFVLSFGIGKQENPADLSILLQKNRAILDTIADRYFFVESPVEVYIDDIQEVQLLINKNPKRDDKREILISNPILIAKKDWESFVNNELIRLKDFANFIVDKENKILIKAASQEKKGLQKIQWVPKNFSVKAKLIEPLKPLDENGNFNENSIIEHEGYAEKNVINLNEGQVIQFERVCFCRLDDKNKMIFIWGS
jgi:glutamyl-tRNA synthetase